MAAGRKPTPTSLKVLRGNPGKRPINENEPDCQPFTTPPKPPPRLGSLAKKEWKSLAATMCEARLLTPADLAAFEDLCRLRGRQQEAARELKRNKGLMTKDAKGNLVVHPMYQVEKELAAPIKQLLTEFGLTPSSRSRITVTPKSGGDDFDEFD